LIDFPAVLADISRSVHDDHELAAVCTLLREHSPRRQDKLVSLSRDGCELPLATAREQRHLLDQLDLGVLAQKHDAILIRSPSARS
jgi:hypothetical protein